MMQCPGVFGLFVVPIISMWANKAPNTCSHCMFSLTYRQIICFLFTELLHIQYSHPTGLHSFSFAATPVLSLTPFHFYIESWQIESEWMWQLALSFHVLHTQMFVFLPRFMILDQRTWDNVSCFKSYLLVSTFEYVVYS